jgi:hypothetical protein
MAARPWDQSLMLRNHVAITPDANAAETAGIAAIVEASGSSAMAADIAGIADAAVAAVEEGEGEAAAVEVTLV